MSMNLLISSLSSFTADNGILGTYVFGSNLELKNNPNSDIDLLIVVKEKDLKTKRIIEQALNKDYNVIHHPDFYSKRHSTAPIIELIVMPYKSKYFKNEYKGILTGLSAFVQGKYKPINNSPGLDTLLGLPISNFDLNTRIEIILKCEWGINDYLSKIWPLLNIKKIEIDFNRVVKFLIMDLIWVLTGRMIKDQIEQQEVLMNKVRHEYPEFAGMIMSLSELTKNNSELRVIESLFQILFDLRKQFKKFNKS